MCYTTQNQIKNEEIYTMKTLSNLNSNLLSSLNSNSILLSNSNSSLILNELLEEGGDV